jgi:hypothetical protein
MEQQKRMKGMGWGRFAAMIAVKPVRRGVQ